jgi:hypothetical protein
VVERNQPSYAPLNKGRQVVHGIGRHVERARADSATKWWGEEAKEGVYGSAIAAKAVVFGQTRSDECGYISMSPVWLWDSFVEMGNQSTA